MGFNFYSETVITLIHITINRIRKFIVIASLTVISMELLIFLFRTSHFITKELLEEKIEAILRG